MRILVVEDEMKTASYLKKGLSENGFLVDTVSRGTEAMSLIKSSNYDLLILDVMLPDYNGWDIIREIRRQGCQTPAIFLTARDSVNDRVHGLELGADDYLVKPFAFSELLARVRTILRRAPARLNEILTVADLELDLKRMRAIRNGKVIDLTPKEFLLLSLFVEHKGEVLSRTLIAEQVWDMHFHSDTNVVDVAIRRLRQKVDDPFSKKLIRTVRGVGYILEDPET
ncbi:MAG: heavy metal response regulator transcription factor [Candidatus Kryptoniota bacterium]